MSIHMPGFQSFFQFFLHNYALAKLATSSIRVILYTDVLSDLTGNSENKCERADLQDIFGLVLIAE